MNTIPSPKTQLAVREEQSQAIVRLVIFGIVFAYAAWYAMGRGDLKIVMFLAAYLAVAMGIYAAIRLWPAANATRRMLGIVADATVITVALVLTGRDGAGFVGVYLFVIFGNGFRYGRIYSHVSQLLCLAGFVLIFILVPWWGHEPYYFLGWLVALILLPLYVSQFTERLKVARKEAEQALKECHEREGRSG